MITRFSPSVQSSNLLSGLLCWRNRRSHQSGDCCEVVLQLRMSPVLCRSVSDPLHHQRPPRAAKGIATCLRRRATRILDSLSVFPRAVRVRFGTRSSSRDIRIRLAFLPCDVENATGSFSCASVDTSAVRSWSVPGAYVHAATQWGGLEENHDKYKHIRRALDVLCMRCRNRRKLQTTRKVTVM